MSDLIVLSVDTTDTADEVFRKLRAMEKEHLIDLEDACVAVRDEQGKIHEKQAVNLTAIGAMSGPSWGVNIRDPGGCALAQPARRSGGRWFDRNRHGRSVRQPC